MLAREPGLPPLWLLVNVLTKEIDVNDAINVKNTYKKKQIMILLINSS